MIKLPLAIDGWFDVYQYLDDDFGYLPDIGISAYSSRLDVDRVFYSEQEPDALDVIKANLMAAPCYHHLNSAGIAFWSPTPCWKCSTEFSPHSLVSKAVSCLEQIRVDSGFGEYGQETIGYVDPAFMFDCQKQPYLAIPFAAEHMDKMLLNVWRDVVSLANVKESIAAPAALIAHTHSKTYGGKYWSLSCPHCQALQGENSIKLGPAMGGSPDLIVMPHMDGAYRLGGKFIGRVHGVAI